MQANAPVMLTLFVNARFAMCCNAINNTIASDIFLQLGANNDLEQLFSMYQVFQFHTSGTFSLRMFTDNFR